MVKYFCARTIQLGQVQAQSQFQVSPLSPSIAPPLSESVMALRLLFEQVEWAALMEMRPFASAVNNLKSSEDIGTALLLGEELLEQQKRMKSDLEPRQRSGGSSSRSVFG